MAEQTPQGGTHEPARPLWWVGQLFRLALGVFLIALALLGNDDSQHGEALAGLAAFGVAYAFSPNWRAVIAPIITCAFLSPFGVAGGMGTGLAMGLWLWMAFHVTTKPLVAIVQALR